MTIMGILAVLLVFGFTLSGSAPSLQTARQITRTGSFDLPCSSDTAFPLFSPEGERLWIKEWNPRPVFPDHIEFHRDTVFREGDGDGEGIWMILDADWQSHRAEYVRLAPVSHSARIVVKIEDIGPNRCRVTVSYTVTAFGEHAAAVLEAFSEGAYAAKMQSWQQRIATYLRASQPQ
jgi:hypothetical protein